MSDPHYLDTPQGRRIAFRYTQGRGPVIVFCHGLRSDMEGTKALHLEDWAHREGRSFLRFDCSGHGLSGGRFEDGSIGDWLEDSAAALTSLAQGRVIIVGSSMGGWLALLLAREMPERVAGLVTIAAAPDFTEDSFWAAFNADQRRQVMEEGRISLPSDYEAPLVVTRRLIEDGRARLVLRSPLDLAFPTRFLQGTADEAVDMSVALRLLDHARGEDIRLTLVRGADHRFSGPRELDLITAAVAEVLAGAAG